MTHNNAINSREEEEEEEKKLNGIPVWNGAQGRPAVEYREYQRVGERSGQWNDGEQRQL